jgi:hypothetical protein
MNEEIEDFEKKLKSNNKLLEEAHIKLIKRK